jgi:hypothetical protein
MQVQPCLERAIPEWKLRQKRHMYSTRPSDTLNLLDLQQFRIVNTIEGGTLMDSLGKHIVFTIFPRQPTLSDCRKTSFQDMKALDKLQEIKRRTSRSDAREGHCEGPYSTTGMIANQGGHGINVCKFKEMDTWAYGRLVNMMKRSQGIATGYICCALLQGLTEVLSIAKCPTMDKTKTPRTKKKNTLGKEKTEEEPRPTIFAALANAINYWSPAHTDQDFFYSLFTINVAGVTTVANPTYPVDASIVHYFVFPEYGIAVAMRPGDMLLFNPQHFHCLSQKEGDYDSNDVYVTSFYLKTAVISKNDNRIALTETEEEMLDHCDP